VLFSESMCVASVDTHGLGHFDRIRGSLRCVRGSLRCVRELRMCRTYVGRFGVSASCEWVGLRGSLVSASCEWVGLRGLLRCVRELRMDRTSRVAPRVRMGRTS
jgi:hypothetical protein